MADQGIIPCSLDWWINNTKFNWFNKFFLVYCEIHTSTSHFICGTTLERLIDLCYSDIGRSWWRHDIGRFRRCVISVDGSFHHRRSTKLLHGNRLSCCAIAAALRVDKSCFWHVFVTKCWYSRHSHHMYSVTEYKLSMWKDHMWERQCYDWWINPYRCLPITAALLGFKLSGPACNPFIELPVYVFVSLISLPVWSCSAFLRGMRWKGLVLDQIKCWQRCLGTAWHCLFYCWIRRDTLLVGSVVLGHYSLGIGWRIFLQCHTKTTDSRNVDKEEPFLSCFISSFRIDWKTPSLPVIQLMLIAWSLLGWTLGSIWK